MPDEIILRKFDCLRCEDSFYSAQAVPKYCGKCKNRGWNKPRVRRPKGSKRHKTTKATSAGRLHA